LGNAGHAPKWPISPMRYTGSGSEDAGHQCHHLLEGQHATPSAFESNAKQFRTKRMKSFEFRLERIEKDMMEVSVGLGARFDSLAGALRVVEGSVLDLFAHMREQSEMCTEMRTSLAELSKKSDELTEVYRMLSEVALVAEEAKQTRMQLDVFETRVKDMEAIAETHSIDLDDVRRAVRKEQKDREEWCSISKGAIQNIEAFCIDVQCQVPVLAKNELEHSSRFLPQMSSSAARLFLNDARMLVSETCPTLPGRCGRRIANSFITSLKNMLSRPLPKSRITFVSWWCIHMLASSMLAIMRRHSSAGIPCQNYVFSEPIPSELSSSSNASPPPSTFQSSCVSKVTTMA